MPNSKQKSCTIGGCCACVITTVGSIFLTLWMASLRANSPKCYIKSLYLPSLNKTLLHSNNNSIFFTLKLTNTNKDQGVQYEAVRVSFGLFVTDNSTLPVVNASLDGFYQGHGKTALKSGSAKDAGGGVNRTVADGRGGMGVYLRVEMAMEVKYKSQLWYSKRHRLWGGANVEVNTSTGEKVNTKDIRLGKVLARIGSGAAEARGTGILVVVLVALCVFLS